MLVFSVQIDINFIYVYVRSVKPTLTVSNSEEFNSLLFFLEKMTFYQKLLIIKNLHDKCVTDSNLTYVHTNIQHSDSFLYRIKEKLLQKRIWIKLNKN